MESASLPAFSIVLTCYRHAPFIAEALQSVFAQDYAGAMELIVVDDASPDDSVDIIRETIARYGANWAVKLICHEVNKGVVAATNAGWKEARYEWIIEADGDDIQLPDRCAQTAEVIAANPSAAFIAMSQVCVDAEGHEQSRRLMLPLAPPGADAVADLPRLRADIYLRRCSDADFGKGVFGCSIALRKSLVQRWGPLAENAMGRYAQDLPWEARAFLSAPLVRSNRLACAYRAHDCNIYNKAQSLRSVADWCRAEWSACRYAAFECETQRQILADCLRVLESPALSDWSRADVRAACRMQRRLVRSHHLRVSWWSRSFIARCCCLVVSWFGIAPEFRRWFLLRLLPFSWVAFLRARRAGAVSRSQ